MRDYEIPGHLPVDLPAPVTINSVALLKVYHNLKPLTGTGSCGYRNEYLISLVKSILDPQTQRAVSRHVTFVQVYVNAALPKWYYYVA